MENNMLKKITNYRKGDNNSLLEIIEIFNPLISKYSRLLDKEDTRQDLIMHLIKILNNIPIDNKRVSKNKEIIGLEEFDIVDNGIQLKELNRALVERLVERITVGEKEIEVEWKFIGEDGII